MTFQLHRLARTAALVLGLGASALAGAQSLDALKGMAGGAGGMGSFSSGSMGNVAGVLEYCAKNKYLSEANSVKDGLMGKMPGGQAAATQDSGYIDGAKGILTGSDGKKTDLTSGMTDSIKKQACDFVLKQGKSML